MSFVCFQKTKLLIRKKEEGNSLYREGKSEGAYQVYSEALEIDPLNVFTNAKLYCNRALAGSKVSCMDYDRASVYTVVVP